MEQQAAFIAPKLGLTRQRKKYKTKRDIKREEEFEKEYFASEKWDLTSDACWVAYDAGSYDSHDFRKIKDELERAIQNIFSEKKARYGLVAIRAVGVELSNMLEELKILTCPDKRREYGWRRAKIRLLLEYDMTEYLYDNYEDKREILLSFIKASVRRKQALIKELSKRFEVEIPTKLEFDFNSKFNDRVQKWIDKK